MTLKLLVISANNFIVVIVIFKKMNTFASLKLETDTKAQEKNVFNG